MLVVFNQIMMFSGFVLCWQFDINLLIFQSNLGAKKLLNKSTFTAKKVDSDTNLKKINTKTNIGEPNKNHGLI